MNSHDLARLLLTLPDLPVATHANNHTNDDQDLAVGKLQHYTGEKIIIGNFNRTDLNPPNWWVSEVYGL